jgi:hypothetical protein
MRPTPEVCVLYVKCAGNGNEEALLGDVTVTQSGSGKPAFPSSILVTQTVSNDWVPKGVVEVQCKLKELTDTQNSDYKACITGSGHDSWV